MMQDNVFVSMYCMFFRIIVRAFKEYGQDSW